MLLENHRSPVIKLKGIPFYSTIYSRKVLLHLTYNGDRNPFNSKVDTPSFVCVCMCVCKETSCSLLNVLYQRIIEIKWIEFPLHMCTGIFI